MAHSFLEYARLKTIFTTIRLLVNWSATPPKPDDSYSFRSRDGSRNIKVNVYRSKWSSSPKAVVLNFYGGGFVLTGHGSDDLFCRRIADQTIYTVLDASYALAPEYPFPAGLEDVEDMIQHVLLQPEEYDVQNIVLSGFSSGANLAVAAASNPDITTTPKDTIRPVCAFYLPTKITISQLEKTAPDGSTAQIPPPISNASRAAYTLPGTDLADPRLSVLNAHPSNFPKDIFIATAEKDVLAFEGEELASKLRKAGKRVVSERFNGVGHGWDKTKDEDSIDAKVRDKAYDMVIQFLSDLNRWPRRA
ncbi:alpha/beta-hydrolase [Microthyrium microscopicum]|uniref:Alpha/beta-hydrolase n=1 Tax=Microthyrium microscopicum TaxID=703497 RepID=A0A6A6U2H2_9PEZI|nr:alpha/beta-hydrolase [Microthyrium microscopicum]